MYFDKNDKPSKERLEMNQYLSRHHYFVYFKHFLPLPPFILVFQLQ